MASRSSATVDLEEVGQKHVRALASGSQADRSRAASSLRAWLHPGPVEELRQRLVPVASAFAQQEPSLQALLKLVTDESSALTPDVLGLFTVLLTMPVFRDAVALQPRLTLDAIAQQLVRLLNASDATAADLVRRTPKIRTYAATTLHNYTGVPTFAKSVVKAGAMKALVQQLRTSTDPPTRSSACSAIVNLIRASSSRAKEAAVLGVVPAASKLAHSSHADAQMAAAGLFQTLFQHLKPSQLPQRQRDLMFNACLHLLQHSSNTELLNLTLSVIRLLCLHDFQYATGALDAGALQAAALLARAADSTPVKANGLMIAFTLLQAATQQHEAAAVAAGLLEAAAQLIDCQEHGAAQSAVMVICQICQDKAEYAKRAAEAGAIPGFMHRAMEDAQPQETAHAMMLVMSHMLASPCKPQHLQQVLDAGWLDLLRKRLAADACSGPGFMYCVLAANTSNLVMQQHGHDDLVPAVGEALLQLLQQGQGMPANTAATALLTLGTLVATCPQFASAQHAALARVAARHAASEHPAVRSAAEHVAAAARGEEVQLVIMARKENGQVQQEWQRQHTRETVAELADAAGVSSGSSRASRASRASQAACAACGADSKPDGKALMECSACHGAHYCSRECQRKHWKVHKKECAPYYNQKHSGLE